MRKLLMASAAILGASGSLAFAQTTVVPAAPSQGQMAAPYAGGASYNSNNNAWGIANTPSGSAAAGGLSTYGALGQNFYAVPAPGTVVIRLNGRVEVDGGVGFTSLDNTKLQVPASISSTGVVTPAGAITNYKLNPVNLGSYMRLYPGFDGVATNGLRYGAQIELRENFQPAQAASGTPASVSIASPSAGTSAQTVFVRRAYTYLASDQAGIIRFGQGDGVIGLFDNCIFTSQCWDAGAGVFQSNIYGGMWPGTAMGGGATNYPWLAQAGAEYGNNKITYLTPQLYGFDFGIQYAPNEGNSFANATGAPGYPATVGNTTVITDTLQSVTTGNTQNRWYNQAGAGLRYEGTFGAVDVKAYGFYEHAAHEDGPHSVAINSANNFDDISFYQGGIAVTTAGLTAAVTYQGGRVDNQLALVPKGGAPMSALVAGLTYINGPWTLGSTVGLIDTQGSASLVGVSQRHQFELGIGGNYKLAPGVNVALEYGYYQTHQGDFNFETNAVGGSAYNDVKGQALMFVTALTW